MKKYLLLTASVFTFAAAQAHAAEVKPYVSAKAVYSYMQGSAKVDGETNKTRFKAPGASIAAGAKIDDFRAELEFSYIANKTKKGFDVDGPTKDKLAANSLMINGYYDIPTGTILMPYVGAGVGMAKAKYKFDFYDSGVAVGEKFDKTKFAYNFSVGLGVKIVDGLIADVGYRYANFGSFKKDGVKFKSYTDEVILGLRFEF